MSDEVVLRIRESLALPVSAESVRPDRFAALDARAIAALPIWIAGERHSLGDLAEVRGERHDRVRIDGDAVHLDALGERMTAGTLLVDGDAGRFVGRAMRGGRIHVRGSAGRGAGCARPGEARGMTGGEIVIERVAGPDVGTRMRRGLIVVGGDAAADAGRGMIAGTIIVCGDAASGAATWNKRGTLLAMGRVEVPRTYRYACTYRPPFVALALRSVRSRYGLQLKDSWLTGLYRRYSGDFAALGRGEILHLVEA